ncbi:possible phage-related protein (plasmid) [Bacillus cereus E33L]|uniref:Possible phage-related protein n=1 Tax=Bacillus cereus (strain ZK / E33L) TaxID=288681 RepID=Q4V1V4_BACCZ|nr:possible phage-related protein [Bacillus cereus E33L]
MTIRIIRYVLNKLNGALDEDERRIIEMKYMKNRKGKDSYVYNVLMMKRDSFYEEKRSGIRLIATVLGIYILTLYIRVVA